MVVLLVVGATGGVGREVVRELLAISPAGTIVRALVRDPAKVQGMWGTAAAGPELHVGDVTRPDSVAPAIAGADVVIMAHSRRSDEAGSTPEAVDYAGTVAISQLAKSAGVSKLVYVTSNSVNRPEKTVVQALNWFGGMGMAWKLRAEGAVRSCGVPYVIVRPVGLKDDGDETAVIQQEAFGLGRISRRAVGQLCARAVAAAPANSTIHCSGVAPEGGQPDLSAAFAALVPDSAPGMSERTASATFEEHEQATNAFAWKVRLGGVGLLGAVVACIYKAKY